MTRKRLLDGARIVVGLLVLVAIFAALQGNWDKVAPELARLSWVSLGGAFLLALVAAFVPAAAAGLLLGDTIKSVLFGTWPVVAAWVVGGVLLVAFGKKLRTAEGAGLD